jgi:N-acetylglucosamine kinase-like BadF-type ATPase
MNVFIGIDGGGTKTRAVAVTADGQLIADHIGDGSNVNRHGWERGLGVLADLFAQIRAALPAHAHVASVNLGLAGVDREPQKKRMLDWVQEQWPTSHVRVENDARIALASGGGVQEGIVLIAGTGSIAFGINQAGEHARVGGWGYLIGDEGSGYDIGRQAIAAVMRSFDGREQATVLVEKLLTTYGLDEPTALIPLVYDESFSRERMAGVARLVLEAAGEGDAVSLHLLERAADELCLLVEVLKTKVAFSQAQVTAVLTGGLLHRGSLLVDLISKRLAPAVHVMVSERPPVVGAVRLAQAMTEEVCSEALAKRLEEIPS